MSNKLEGLKQYVKRNEIEVTCTDATVPNSEKTSNSQAQRDSVEIEKQEKELSAKKDLFRPINIEDIEKQLTVFKDLEKEIKSLEEDKIAFEIEIKSLKNASNELSSKICPYLKENCENLKDKENEFYRI